MIRPGGTVETEVTVPCGAPYTPNFASFHSPPGRIPPKVRHMPI